MTTPVKNDIRLNLVISGIPGYMKLRSQYDDLLRSTALSLRHCIDYVESKLPGNVEIHGLFNAHIEENQVRRASSKGVNVPYTTIFPKGMHSDSGGLQMITLNGKTSIEKEDREKIYDTQSKYSHYAMSFDEIPVIVKNKVKYYLPNTVKEKGITSGYNLKEQFDYFDKLKTDCKIIPIVQGWGIEDTDLFAKGLFDKLSNKQLKSIDILATGFVSSSTYATAKRVYDMFKAKEIPNNALKTVHLLGVTGFKRLIPALELIKNGFTPQLEVLSFDSVKLSMSYVIGRQIPTIEDLLNGTVSTGEFGKERNKNVDVYWKKLYDFWKDDPHFLYDDVEDLIEHSYYNSEGRISGHQQYKHYLKEDDNGNYTEENKKIADLHYIKVLKQEQYYVLFQVYNYINILESFLEDKIKLEHIFDGKDLQIFTLLQNVKSDKEFEEWFEYVKQATGFKIPVEDDTSAMDSLF